MSKKQQPLPTVKYNKKRQYDHEIRNLPIHQSVEKRHKSMTHALDINLYFCHFKVVADIKLQE